MRRIVAVFLACLISPLLAAPALAHGDIESTRPQPEQVRKKGPSHVMVTFTEAPTEDGRMTVTDGCNENVKREQYVEGRTMHVLLKKGQPGTWNVSYAVISAVDGHKTNGKYSFTVKGETDCSEPEPEPEVTEVDAPNDAEDVAADPDTSPTSGESGGIPIAIVAVGFVALVGIALLVRMGASRD